MICAWNELKSILPQWLRQEVDAAGKQTMEELRLRINAPPELVSGRISRDVSRICTKEDLDYCVNAASRYSPWAASTAASGYITAPGGHRIGLCGEAVVQNGKMTGIRRITSLCIRIAKDYPGIAAGIPCKGSVLILGAPGWGKTTLLRDLIRQISDKGEHVSVVDERGELFHGNCFSLGNRTDVLTGCPKPEGIDTLLRTMGPSWIAVDEVTAASDCDALIHAAWCGVKLLATAHATSAADLRNRAVYRPLAQSGVFQTIVILHPDKSWRTERIEL